MRLRLFTLLFLLSLRCSLLFAQGADSVRMDITVSEGESWWVGIVNHGSMMPLSAGYRANLQGFIYGNQAQPLLLSSKGNIIWSSEAFAVKRDKNIITLTKGSGAFVAAKAGTSLREAYLYASKTFFPPSGAMPDQTLFQSPQYNTWIELLYNQNQKDVLHYAKAIIDNGFPPGVIMIDDNWQEDYGTWKFHPARFPNPTAMMDTLHRWGFKVMLWVCPFVSPDSETFRKLQEQDLLLKDDAGEPKMVRWWNGASAELDFTNQLAVSWYNEQLRSLMTTNKVDGFKFDAGDPEFYKNVHAKNNVSPNEHAELFAKIGTAYPLNEYRATWKMGGQALAQRLRDKGHSWHDLQLLIPNILLQGIMGYPFTCPDMIGGGEMGSFLNLKNINQDLVVRSAQLHALMPMMQFSVAPWRILDAQHLSAVKSAVALRMKYTDQIISLAKDAAKTGEPIVRMMEYNYPNQGFGLVNDQFMLGENILVAPILSEAPTRKIVLPKGKWKDETHGKIFTGPKTIESSATLAELLIFTKQ